MEAHAQPEIEIKNKKEKVSLELKDSTIVLRIQSASSFTANVFTLENPARIVIDALGLKLRSQKSATPGSNALLKGFRLGFYPDKVRFVLDLKGDQLPPYTTSQEKNTFTLRIGGEDELIKLEPPSEEREVIKAPEKSPLPARTAEAEEVKEEATLVQPRLTSQTPVKEAIKKETATPEPTNTAVATATVPPQKSVAPATPTQAENVQMDGSVAEEAGVENELKRLMFEDSEQDASLLRLRLWKEPTFKLTKDKSFYTLTIPDCVPSGKHLILAHYPPENFTGVNAVQVAYKNKDTVLTIYVERGTKLNAYRSENEIVVKAVVKSPL